MLLVHASMKTIEKAMVGVVLGAVPVIACFLAGWWLSIPLIPESRIFIFALLGVVLGIFIDIVFLRGWIQRAYLLKNWIWMSVYIFYSVGMLGFFMGVPVFNVLLALPAGFLVGCKLIKNHNDFSFMQKTAQKAAIFTSSIMGFVCITSATIALISDSTAYDLQHMLGFPFKVTQMMIIGIILIGGSMILFLNWWLTIKSVERTYKYYLTHDNINKNMNDY